MIDPDLNELDTILFFRGSERRKLRRFYCRNNGQVLQTLLSTFRRFQGIIQDTTSEGLGILSPYAVQLETVVAIRVEWKLTGKSGLLTGKVCQCTSREDGTWLIGYSLLRSLTDEEIKSLLLPQAPSRGTEQTANPRQSPKSLSRAQTTATEKMATGLA